MEYWISTFTNYIEKQSEAELSDWLLTGLSLFHDPNSKAYQRADLAFTAADYAFGQMGEQRAVTNELLDVYKHLQSIDPLRFDKSLAKAIAQASLNSFPRKEAFRSLIEIALETRSSQAVKSLHDKLHLIAPEAIDIICADLVYFLYKGHDRSALLELGRAILTINYPYQISAMLLIGLIGIDPENTIFYIKEIKNKLLIQLSFLRNNSRNNYETFKLDFLSSLKRNESFVFKPEGMETFEALSKVLTYREIASLFIGKEPRTRKQTMHIILDFPEAA